MYNKYTFVATTAIRDISKCIEMGLLIIVVN